MSASRLTIAVGVNDRTLPLIGGLATIEGVSANYITAPLEEIFARAFDQQAFDVTELSFSNYLYLTATGQSPYIGLPIFPSRSFRHSAIYIRTDRGIRSPRDLAGRLVGVREYSMTAALVARGVLEDDYGLRAQDVRWRYGRADGKDTHPIARMLPNRVELEPIEPAETLSDLLKRGQLDAMVAYKPPPAFLEGDSCIRRLFDDFVAVELDYARRTGIFPIMHLIGVRRELVADDPDLPRRVCQGFERARRYSFERLQESQALYGMLPWGPVEVQKTIRALGENYWSYGYGENQRAIEALCRYSFAQGISPRLVHAEELFEPSVISWAP